MYTNEEIIEKLRLGLQICYEQNKEKVSKENMRLALTIEDVKMGPITIGQQTKVELVDASNRNARVALVKMSDLFSITMAESIGVNVWLTNKMKKFAGAEQIPENQVSAHIYTTQENFYPAVRLCQHGQFKKELTLQELTN